MSSMPFSKAVEIQTEESKNHQNVKGIFKGHQTPDTPLFKSDAPETPAF